MDKDKVISILQSLKDMNLKNSMHKLEEESGVYFNLKYVEEMCLAGEWVDLERYVSCFTKFHESSDIFCLIRENRHRDSIKRADEELYKELLKDQYPPAKIVGWENSADRHNVLLQRYGNTDTVRIRSLTKLIEMINLDPNLSTKLDFPMVPPLPLLPDADVPVPIDLPLLDAAAIVLPVLPDAAVDADVPVPIDLPLLDAAAIVLPVLPDAAVDADVPVPIVLPDAPAIVLPDAPAIVLPVLPDAPARGRVTRSRTRQLAGFAGIPAAAKRRRSSLTPPAPEG